MNQVKILESKKHNNWKNSLEGLNHRFELVGERITKYVTPFSWNVQNKKFSRGKKYISGYLWLEAGYGGW